MFLLKFYVIYSACRRVINIQCHYLAGTERDGFLIQEFVESLDRGK